MSETKFDPPACCPACGAPGKLQPGATQVFFECGEVYSVTQDMYRENCSRAFGVAVYLRAERDALRARAEVAEDGWRTANHDYMRLKEASGVDDILKAELIRQRDTQYEQRLRIVVMYEALESENIALVGKREKQRRILNDAKRGEGKYTIDDYKWLVDELHATLHAALWPVWERRNET